MSEVFRTGKVVTRYPQAPVPVLIAGQAIIATRCLSVLLLANELGYDGVSDFIHRSAGPGLHADFFASQIIFLSSCAAP